MVWQLFFGWVTPIVSRGYAARQLQYSDLLPTPHHSTSSACSRALWHQWVRTCTWGSPSLLKAIVAAYGGPYFRLGVLKLLNDALTFAGAMLLNLLVQHLEQAAAGGGGSSGSSSSGSSNGSLVHEQRMGNATWYGLVMSAGAHANNSTSIAPCSSDCGAYWGSGNSSNSPGGLLLDPRSASWGFMLAALLSLSALAKAVIGSHYNYGLSMVAVRLRSGVMGVLFRNALLTRAADASGDVNTLMSVDTSRLANLCVSFHELWSLPLQIVAAMWLLYIQVRTAFIAGVILCIALIPINRLIAQKIQAASVQLMSSKDGRIALLGEVLRHIGVVKALGWENVLANKIQGFRASELSALARRKYLDALCVYFWAGTQLLLSGTTFSLMVLLGQPLRPSTVFTSLALFNILIAPLNAFPWVVNGVVEAIVSLQRVQAYLLLPQRALAWAYQAGELQAIKQCQQQQQHAAWQLNAAKVTSQAGRMDHTGLAIGVSVHFCNASFSWLKSQTPSLYDLHLALPSGCLTAVVGEVGSGKSSLLAAILGELELLQGAAHLPAKQAHCYTRQQQQRPLQGQQIPGRVAFVSQAPWLMRGSVRDNILMGQPYDPQYFSMVLHAVGLDQDLAVMPAGGLTPVGEAGSKLSGGQKLRVALARALYQQGVDVYLFDDVLASLDNHVAQWVIHHTLLGGLLSGATVVVVTKHPMVVQAAQLVVALQSGRVAFSGSPSGYANWKAGDLKRQALHSQTTTAAATSEDVSAHDLLPIGNGGVWANHASCLPQLVAIQESEEAMDSMLLSQPELQTADEQSFTKLHTWQQVDQKQHWQPEIMQLQQQQQQQQHVVQNGLQLLEQQQRQQMLQQLQAAADDELQHAIIQARGDSGDASANPGAADCDEESRAVGAVAWPVYVSYGKAVGIVMCLAVVLSLVAMQATKNGIDLWVAHSVTYGNSTIAATGLQPMLNTSQSADVKAAASFILGSRIASVCFNEAIDCSWMAPARLHAALASTTAKTAISTAATAAVSQIRPCLVCCADWPAASVARNLLQINHCAWNSSMLRTVGFVRSRSKSSSSNIAQAGNRKQKMIPKVARRLLLPSELQQSTAMQPASWLPQAAQPQQMQQWQPNPGKHSSASTLITQQAQAGNAVLDSTLHSNSISWRPAALEPDLARFLKVLGVIAALNTLATLARAFSFAAAGMSAARSLHQRLLLAVLAAPIAFFDANPAGRILNRFLSDTSIVDDSLPFILNILLANAMSLAGLLAVLLIGQPALLLVLVPLGIVYRRLQLFYRATARELRRLEAAGLSPLYGLFSEVVTGAPTLRGLGVQQHFMQRFLLKMAPYQSACINNAAASNWLAARLQLLAAVLLAAVAGLTAAMAAAQLLTPAAADAGTAQSAASSSNTSWSGSPFHINLLGLALAYSLPIVQLLNGLLTSSAETEQEMVAVERVVMYLDGIEPEEPLQQQQQQNTEFSEPLLLQQSNQQHEQFVGSFNAVVAAAAASAAIAFVDVVMSYRPALPPALMGVSFLIEPGQKLGMCGRTGAGKSSIVSALLRLWPIQSGCIVVEGKDASTLPLKELRSRFGLVPQSPVLFSGTIRDNLDPLGAASDQQLAGVLQAVHMWGRLCQVAFQKRLLSHSGYMNARRVPRSAGHPLPQLSQPAGHSQAQSMVAAIAANQHQHQHQQQPSGSGSSFYVAGLKDANEILSLEVGSTAGALQLSAGEAQLICLARLLVRAAPLVILDEATAAVDPKTAALMHKTLIQQLKATGYAQPGHTTSTLAAMQNPTVLQIAHDLNAILEYDTVVVMEGGRVLETGCPRSLKQQPGSHFQQLLKKAGLAEQHH